MDRDELFRRSLLSWGGRLSPKDHSEYGLITSPLYVQTGKEEAGGFSRILFLHLSGPQAVSCLSFLKKKIHRL